MFTTKTIKTAYTYTNLGNIGKNYTKNVVSMNDENNELFSLINFSNDIFLNKDESYKYFFENGTISSCNYYQNIIPAERNPTLSTLEFFIDNRQLTYDNEFLIYSNYPIYSLYGINFKSYNNYISIAKINISEQTITYPKETKYLSFINNNENICIQNWTWKLLHGHMIYLDKLIGSLSINPLKSHLLHPFIFPYFKFLFNLFQNNPSATYTMNIPQLFSSVASSITLYQPRYIYSINNGSTYFKYNSSTSSFDNVSFSAGYPTFSEFLTYGNSYNEYINIPKTKWETKLGSSSTIKIYTNTYVPIIHLHNSIFNINTGEFLWSYERKPRRVIVKGTI